MLYCGNDAFDFNEFSIYVVGTTNDVNEVEDAVYRKLKEPIIDTINNILDDCISILEKEELSEYDCKTFQDYVDLDDNIYELYSTEDKLWCLENAQGYTIPYHYIN